MAKFLSIFLSLIISGNLAASYTNYKDEIEELDDPGIRYETHEFLYREIAGTYSYDNGKNCKLKIIIERDGRSQTYFNNQLWSWYIDDVDPTKDEYIKLHRHANNRLNISFENGISTIYEPDNMLMLSNGFCDGACETDMYYFANCAADGKSNLDTINLVKQEQKSNYKIKDKLDLNASFLKNNELPNLAYYLGRFAYQGTFIEDFQMQDLLNNLHDLLSFITIEDGFISPLDEAQNKINFANFLQFLLIARIEQFQDPYAFKILNKIAAYNLKLRGNGRSTSQVANPYIFALFLEYFDFFIKESYKEQDISLITSLSDEMANNLVREDFLAKNNAKGYIFSDSSSIFPHFLKPYTRKTLLSKFTSSSRVDLPTKNQQDKPSNTLSWWRSDTKSIIFKHFHFDSWHHILNDRTKDFYKHEIHPLLSPYIHRNYHINTKDGYANLRTAPNTSAKIKAEIKNDEYVAFVQEAGNWLYVIYPALDLRGYIHKSQVKTK